MKARKENGMKGGLLAILGALVAGVAVAANVDIFENADFEDMARHGKFDACTEVGRGFGFNGNAGARVSGFTRHSFTLPVKKGVVLKKGERYVFSLETKSNSRDILEQIALETTNPETGKYEGYWGRKYVDIGAGWSREELAFVPKRDLDTSKENLRFILFVQLDPGKNIASPRPEHYIDCDNARLTSEEPLWYFCNTWPTHNKVFCEEGRIRAYSFFIGPFLPKDAQPAYSLRLVKPDGAVLATAAATEARGVLTAAFGKLDYEGPATLVCTLTDRGRSVGTRTRDVTVAPTYVPKKGEVFINERGQTLVDGKPFMPLGFYSSFDLGKYSRDYVEEHLKRIAEAGFNFLIDYSTYKLATESDRAFFYGTCAKYGLRVLADDFAGYQQKPDKIHEIGPKALELAKYPALMGWYTMDEASEDKVPVLDAIRRALNQVTPGHIVLTCNIMEPAPYLPTADVQGGDKYPIDRGDASLRSDESYMRRAGACRSAAGWHAPQWLNWANYRRGACESKEAYDKAGREPEANEMLSVALAYAANGMTGFTFYSYFDMFRGPYPERVATRWENMVKVGRALKDLEPFIVARRKILEIPVTDVKGGTCVVALTDGCGGVRVLVFGLDRDNEATFALPKALGKPASSWGFVRDEGSVYRYAGREFTCDVLK